MAGHFLRSFLDRGIRPAETRITMLTEYNYVLSQVRYVRVAMDLFPDFKPDDYVVSTVDSIIGEAIRVRQDYWDKDGKLSLARGAVHRTHQALHDACVNVHSCLKSAFRKDPDSLNRIEDLPVEDRSMEKTLTRGKDIDVAWGQLPNPPGWEGPFKVGPLTHAVFAGYVRNLEAATRALTKVSGEFELGEGALHRTQAEMSDFVTAALTQGRAQFAPGTSERSVIDHVPTAPATKAPGQVVVSTATSPAAGALHAEFDAPHATSFQVWRKGPGDEQFVMLEESIKPGVYDATGLPPGNYKLQFVGENSRDTGPPSEPVTVTVAVAAVA